jgi:hypothetical protein
LDKDQPGTQAVKDRPWPVPKQQKAFAARHP